MNQPPECPSCGNTRTRWMMMFCIVHQRQEPIGICICGAAFNPEEKEEQ